MVCKKEVCEWFHNLDAPSRIEIVCEVLKMCLPLELRLFGSCLEDLARKDFLPLKEFELKANAFKGLENVEELAQAETRSLLITYACLVHPSNKQCAATMFNMLSSLVPKLEKLQSSGSLEEYLEDALLLMTIAVHHPAFCFEQKQKLIEHLKTVKSMCISKQNGFGSQYTGSAATASIDSCGKPEPVPRSKSFVGPDGITKRDMRMIGYTYPTAISIVGINCRGPANFTIEVTWSNLQKSVVNKTLDDLNNFQLQLSGWCSSANLGGASFEKSKARMQTLLQVASNVIRRGTVHPTLVKKLSLYFSELLKAPEAVPKCEIVRQFFSSSSTHAAFSVPEERGVSAQFVHHGETVADIGSSISPGLERTRTNSKRSATQDPQLCSASDATDPGLAAWSEHQLARSPGLPLAVGHELPVATGRLCAAAADSGGEAKVHHRWPEQLLHLLNEPRLQKHSEKLQSIPFENFLRMTESELMQCGLPEGAARKLVAGRDMFTSNGFALSSSGTPFPAVADESSWHSEPQTAASSKMHLKSEGTTMSRSGNTSAKIASFDEPQGFKSELAASRRPSSQTVRSAMNVAADQSSTTTDFASKQGSQDNSLVHRSMPAVSLPAKERPMSRMYSPASTDSGQQNRRPTVNAGVEASTDSAHILGRGHHQYPPRPGTVQQAAAAAAASCASGIQPVAGSTLREASASHTRKASTEATSSIMAPTPYCPDSLYRGPCSTPPVNDDPVTFISSGSGQMQPLSSCSSPEASSASDGSEADPNAFSSQQTMPVHPSYAPYVACRYPDCYGQFSIPLALATAPSASQISPSNHIPTTFGRPVGTASYSQRPYVPPHGGRYATLPFAHGLHGLPGNIIVPQNGVPGVPGSGSAGDLFFSSRPGTYISVDSQGMPATTVYHRPLPSPHASRGCQPGHLSSAYPSNQGSRKGCYNCGQMGHKASDCRESFPESMLAGQYRLKYESQLDAE